MGLSRLRYALLALFAVVTLFFGATSTLWMIGLVNQWAIPWSTLAILAAPR
jgi:hypothetical protein